MKYVPRNYQVTATEHVLANPRCAVWADMGLGKTSVTLTAITALLETFEVHKVLIVAPLRVAVSVWPQEIQKWDHTRHLPYHLIRNPNPKARARELANPAPIHIINYENLPWLVKTLEGKWPYDMVVLDESTRVKNPRSLRWRALKHVLPAVQRMVQLTGTPAANGLMDLWAPAYLLDKGERLGRTLTMLRSRWFRQVDRDGYKWEPLPKALPEITEKLADICYSLKAEDYLDLPPLVNNRVEVTLPEKAETKYRTLERNFYFELGTGENLVAQTAAARSGKLLQLTAGAVYVNEEGDWEEVHDAKVEALREVIESAGGEPVLVAYQFKSDLARLKRHFPEARELDKHPNTLLDWNAGKIPVLLAHPASAGHGLNLQGGGRHLAFFSLTWSLENYAQIIERIGPTRQLQAGTPRPVYVHHIVARGTIDEVVLERLETKASVQDVLRRAMRDRRIKQ